MSAFEDEVRRAFRQEITNTLRGVLRRSAEDAPVDRRSIRDRVQEIESSIESAHGDDERRDDVTEVLGTPTRQRRVTALEARVGELEQTVKILCDRTHESSFHVADSEAATSDRPATIMVGTPDTDPSQGDGASVEGPAPRPGPSTSSGPLIVPTWTFGDRLRKARRHRRMDQRTLGQHLDVSAATVSMWEKDINLPGNLIRAAQELQHVLRVPAQWLLGVDRP